jgi:hypothetical protein
VRGEALRVTPVPGVALTFNDRRNSRLVLHHSPPSTAEISTLIR